MVEDTISLELDIVDDIGNEFVGTVDLSIQELKTLLDKRGYRLVKKR